MMFIVEYVLAFAAVLLWVICTYYLFICLSATFKAMENKVVKAVDPKWLLDFQNYLAVTRENHGTLNLRVGTSDHFTPCQVLTVNGQIRTDLWSWLEIGHVTTYGIFSRKKLHTSYEQITRFLLLLIQWPLLLGLTYSCTLTTNVTGSPGAC